MLKALINLFKTKEKQVETVAPYKVEAPVVREIAVPPTSVIKETQAAKPAVVAKTNKSRKPRQNKKK